MPPRRKIVGAKHRSVKPGREICAAVGCAAGFQEKVTLAVQGLQKNHDIMKLEGKWSWCRRCGRLREEWWEGQHIGDEGPKTNKITRWWAIGQLITEGEPPCIL